MCELKQKVIYKYTHADPSLHQVIVHHDSDLQSQQQNHQQQQLVYLTLILVQII